MLLWIQEEKQKNVVINDDMIKDEALCIAYTLDYETFKASHGWLKGFMRRNHLDHKFDSIDESESPPALTSVVHEEESMKIQSDQETFENLIEDESNFELIDEFELDECVSFEEVTESLLDSTECQEICKQHDIKQLTASSKNLKPRAKRRFLTTSEKLDIIQRNRTKKETGGHLARCYGVSTSTISDILKKADEIQEFATQVPGAENLRKRAKEPRFACLSSGLSVI